MRILLVQPYNLDYVKEYGALPPAPFALMYLASFLRENGHDVYIFDRNVDRSNLENVIRKICPDMVGISSFTGPMILDALSLARVVRNTTDAPIVWGGIHPSLLPMQTINNPCVDTVVVGEGELTLLDLVNTLENGKSLEDVRGIVYKENGTVHANPPRGFIRNLDELPMPAWDLIDVRDYAWFYIFTSRGCPHNCGFCYNQEYNKRKWRGKSSDRVLEEINYLVSEYKTRRIGIGDDNFTCNRKRLHEICDKIIEEDIDIEWRCESRVDSVNDETLRLMKKAGCHVIYFGVESGSPRILKLINKDIPISRVERTLKNCKETGMATSAAFMVGLPTETREEMEMTRSLALRLPLWAITVKIYVPCPGTALYDFCVRNGLLQPPNSLEEWGFVSSWSDTAINVSDVPAEEVESLRKEIELEIRTRNLPYYLLQTMQRLLDGDVSMINTIGRVLKRR
jgi:radical SAM superfamily enzyme YgiQ (UPF0313 family)